MFERLSWQEDRILLDDLVFYLDRSRNGPEDQGRDGFVFEKPRRLLDQYAAVWPQEPPLSVNNMLELGIYDGGSVAFWFELLQPHKYVALDIKAWGDSDYFDRYVASRKLKGRIKTFWLTDQGDSKALRRIVAAEFDGPLDLVIDDASHLYGPTRASFETLFPLLRPGGLYVIEDWSWGCWPNLPVEFLPEGTELPKLIHQIVDAAGSMHRFLVGAGLSMTIKPLIANITVCPDIVIVERGDADAAEVSDFNLEGYITCRPSSSNWRRRLGRIRRAQERWVSLYGSKLEFLSKK